MTTTGGLEHPIVDPVAVALGARAIGPIAPLFGGAWTATGTALAAPLRLAFVAAALPAEDRSKLVDGSGFVLGAPDARSGLQMLQGSAEALRVVASSSPALRALWAAHANAHAAPRRPRIMGILNVTPDSFSDGGAYASASAAIERALEMLEEGADIVDVGGESTRPGAAPVSTADELERVLPVVDGVRRERPDATVSIDTSKADVARAAIDAGASMVNDVSAGRFDADMLPLVAERDVDVVLMHMQNTPRDMQDDPSYDDVVREVVDHLRNRAAVAWKLGVRTPRIVLDPGIGFGKSLNDNLQLLRSVPELRSLGMTTLVGVSRKSFLGRLTGTERTDARVTETVAATATLCALGADIHRVHDVAEARKALTVARAIRDARPEARGD